MTRIKQGKFSFSAKIALWGWKGYVVSEGEESCMPVLTSHQSQCGLY